MIGIGVATATAGIIVGGITLTGLGLRMTEFVEFVSQGNVIAMLLFIALPIISVVVQSLYVEHDKVLVTVLVPAVAGRRRGVPLGLDAHPHRGVGGEQDAVQTAHAVGGQESERERQGSDPDPGAVLHALAASRGKRGIGTRVTTCRRGPIPAMCGSVAPGRYSRRCVASVSSSAAWSVRSSRSGVTEIIPFCTAQRSVPSSTSSIGRTVTQ